MKRLSTHSLPNQPATNAECHTEPTFDHEPKVFEIKDTTVKISVEQKSLFSPRKLMAKGCGFCAALSSCAAQSAGIPRKKEGWKAAKQKRIRSIPAVVTTVVLVPVKPGSRPSTMFFFFYFFFNFNSSNFFPLDTEKEISQFRFLLRCSQSASFRSHSGSILPFSHNYFSKTTLKHKSLIF